VAVRKRAANITTALMGKNRVEDGIAGDRENEASQKQCTGQLFDKRFNIRSHYIRIAFFTRRQNNPSRQ
jgi:hypothetical protein